MQNESQKGQGGMTLEQAKELLEKWEERKIKGAFITKFSTREIDSLREAQRIVTEENLNSCNSSTLKSSQEKAEKKGCYMNPNSIPAPLCFCAGHHCSPGVCYICSAPQPEEKVEKKSECCNALLEQVDDLRKGALFGSKCLRCYACGLQYDEPPIDAEGNCCTPQPKSEGVEDWEKELAIFDFPTAWRLVKASTKENHHEKCSWRTDQLLCDCVGVQMARAARNDLKDFIQNLLESQAEQIRRVERKNMIRFIKDIAKNQMKISKDANETIFLRDGTPVPKGNNREDCYYNLGILELLNAIEAQSKILNE